MLYFTKKIFFPLYNNINSKQLICFLGTSIFILLGFYLYFLSCSIFNVLARENAEQQIGEVQSSISFLSSKYFEKRGKINMETASSYGFEKSNSTYYVWRDSRKSAVSINIER